jgi:hypothetical protein
MKTGKFRGCPESYLSAAKEMKYFNDEENEEGGRYKINNE